MSSPQDLTAPPGAAKVVPALDGLRAVAAGMVVLTHAAYLTGFGVTGGLMGRLWSRGDFGVGIFFALSGFLLHRGLVGRRLIRREIASYALRRAARVLPAYWLTIAAIVVFANPPLRDWILHAAGLQIYVSDAWIASFGQSWSLATEISFYAVLPLVVLALAPMRRRNPALPLLVLVVATALLTLASGIGAGEVFGQDVLYHLWLHARAPQFLVGMICAEALIVSGHPISRQLRRWGSDTGMCLAVTGGALLLATTPITGALTLDPATSSEIIVRTLLCTLVALGLLLPLTLGRPSAYSAALSQPFVRWLGLVSYGVFLWHLPVFTAWYSVTGINLFSGGMAPLLAVGVPVSLLLAAISHHWVEMPASRFVSRLLPRKRQDEGGQDQQTDRSLKA